MNQKYCRNGVQCAGYTDIRANGQKKPNQAEENKTLCSECISQNRRRQPPPVPKDENIGIVPVYAKGETLRKLVTGEEIILRADGSPAGMLACSPYSLRPASPSYTDR